MSTDPDHLRDIYVDVTGQETVTEPREEEPSRDPIGERELELEREVSTFAREDGLEEAVEGTDVEAGA